MLPDLHSFLNSMSIKKCNFKNSMEGFQYRAPIVLESGMTKIQWSDRPKKYDSELI